MDNKEFNDKFDKIINYLLKDFDVEISDDLDLMEVGVDSLKLIKLIMQLEDELGIFWPIDQLAEHTKLTNIRNLRDACFQYATDLSKVGEI